MFFTCIHTHTHIYTFNYKSLYPVLCHPPSPINNGKNKINGQTKYNSFETNICIIVGISCFVWIWTIGKYVYSLFLCLSFLYYAVHFVCKILPYRFTVNTQLTQMGKCMKMTYTNVCTISTFFGWGVHLKKEFCNG